MKLRPINPACMIAMRIGLILIGTIGVGLSALASQPDGGQPHKAKASAEFKITKGLDNPMNKHYLNLVLSRVQGNWQPPTIKTGRVELCFAIDRSGNLQDLSVERSSGDVDLDEYAKLAVRRSASFPMLPQTFDGDKLVVHFWLMNPPKPSKNPAQESRSPK